MTLEYLSKDPGKYKKKYGCLEGMNSLAISETRIRDALISKNL